MATAIAISASRVIASRPPATVEPQPEADHTTTRSPASEVTLPSRTTTSRSA